MSHVDDDAVARYRVASEANDIEGLMQTLTPDIELVSPLSGRMVFRGREDLRSLLAAVYGSLRGWHWREEIGDSKERVLVGEGFIGPFKLGDAMVLELAEDGRIRRFRPHLRPWIALTAFGLVLSAKVGRHPAIVLRALQQP